MIILKNKRVKTYANQRCNRIKKLEDLLARTNLLFSYSFFAIPSNKKKPKNDNKILEKIALKLDTHILFAIPENLPT